MLFHPHTHWIVPGIGLSKTGKLVKLKNNQFLVYGKVLARRMKTIMLKSLKAQNLIPQSLLNELWRIDWNADVQKPGNGENAVKYLGEYVNHSVISDNRIIKVDRNSVWFRVKDREKKIFHPIKIDGVEFIRRFLMHVLPPRFHRVRYRGFMHQRGKANLQLLQLLLNAKIKTIPPLPCFDNETRQCPRCGGIARKDKKHARAPPNKRYYNFIDRMAA